MNRLLICGILLIFLSQLSYAWEISGDSVFVEDSQAKLTVTPEVATSRFGIYDQEFELCNKTASDQDVFIAYVFPSELIAGGVQYDAGTPVFGWVEREFICDYNFSFELNVNPGDQNPHHATCSDFNTTYFDGNFRSGNIETSTIQYDINGKVSGGFVDVSSKFTDQARPYDGRYIYPFYQGKTVGANDCERWKVQYKPTEATGKWDLVLWSGDSWTCILDHSCARELVLDPFWGLTDPNTELIYYEEFDSGSIVADWTITLGSFNDDAGFSYNDRSGGGPSTMNDPFTTFSTTKVQLHARVYHALSINNSITIKFGEYWINTNTNGNFELSHGASALITTVPSISAVAWHDINATRGADGYWEAWLDGNYQGRSATGVIQTRDFSGVQVENEKQGDQVDDISIYRTDLSTDINIMGDFNTFGYIQGGTDHNVWFTVSDADSNATDFLVDFNLSLSGVLGEGTTIFGDLNLSTDFNNFDTNNLSLFDVNAFYLWSVPTNLDGNYFACINLKNTVSDLNFGECTPLSFIIDSTDPITVHDANHNTWQNFDANFTLTCTDNNAGCDVLRYRIDLDPSDSITYADWNVVARENYDINIPLPGLFDGNFAVDFNSVDNIGNEESLNTIWILSDENGIAYGDYYPAVDTESATEASLTFTLHLFTNPSETGTCFYGRYKNGALDSNTSVDSNADGFCAVFSGALSEDDSAYLVFTSAVDLAGNDINQVVKTGEYTYNASTPAPPSGGGGGGGTTTVAKTFEITDPVEKALRVFSQIGTTEEFSMEVTNTSTTSISVTSTIDEILKPYVSCDATVQISKGGIERINCVADLADFNGTSIEGTITLATSTQHEIIAVEITTFQFGVFGQLSSFIKENQTNFYIALFFLFTFTTLVGLGLAGWFKGTAQPIAIFGGGTLGIILLIAIII